MHVFGVSTDKFLAAASNSKFTAFLSPFCEARNLALGQETANVNKTLNVNKKEGDSSHKNDPGKKVK